MNSIDRRQLLKAMGSAGVLSLAGCSGQSAENTSDSVGSNQADGSSQSTDSPDGGSTSSSGLDSVVFGHPAGVTGRWDYLQASVTPAVELAVEEINAAGGPLGAEVELKTRDTKVSPQQAKTVVRQLINSDGAVFIGGLFSSEITSLSQWLTEQKVPIITGWAGTLALSTYGGDKGTPSDLSDDEWIWRTTPGDSITAIAGARHALDEGFEKMGVVSGVAPENKQITSSFKKIFESAGGEIVTEITLSEGKTSYRSEINRLFQNDFDAWWLAVNQKDGLTALRSWLQGGYGRPLITHDALKSEETIKELGSSLNDLTVWSQQPAMEGPNFDRFEKSYREKKSEQQIFPWAPASYDAYNIAALALHRSGKTGSQREIWNGIEKNIRAVSTPEGTEVGTFKEGKEALDNGEEVNYTGAATRCDFTKHGNVFGQTSVYEATPDGYELVSTIETNQVKELVENY